MLELKNVTKTYQTKKSQIQALKEISIRFMDHGAYFILGKSGCGKSTLLNLIAGLDQVTSGEILLDHEDITKFNSKELNRYRNFNIGFVFQEFNLLPNLNVKENIELSLKMQGLKVQEEEIEKILKKVDMPDVLYRNVNELSGGQKQRIAIARALIKNPKMIVADEPTGSLDSETSKQIFSLLKTLSQDHLVIVVSHNEEYAKDFADEIIYLNDGCIERTECFHSIENPTASKTEPFLIDHFPKSSLPVLTSLKMGISNLKTNVVRLCILIFLSMISFICLGVSVTAFQYDKSTLIANAIATGGYQDPLAIVSDLHVNESSWQQSIISPSFIKELNQNLEGTYLAVWKDVGKSNLNFKEDTSIDYSKTYDALSLFSMSGMAVIHQNELDQLGFQLFGKIPTASNEILITKYYYETFLKYGYSYKEIQIDGSQLNEQTIIGKTIEVPQSRHATEMVEYTICGIVDTEVDTSLYSELSAYHTGRTDLDESRRLFDFYQSGSIHSVGFLSESGMDLLYSSFDLEGQGYDCVVGRMPQNKESLKKITQYLDRYSGDERRYRLTNTTDTWLRDVDTLMTTYQMMGGIAGAILIVFSGLLLFNYINLSISHKIKEMGILRALGARGTDIFKIFGWEGFIIALINFVLSVIGTCVFVYIIDMGIRKEYFLHTGVYQVNFLTIFSLFFISFLSCFLSVLFPILKVSRKSPMETIRVE